MVNIEIYTKATCPYCCYTKTLISRKGVPFQEILLDKNVNLYEEMVRRSGRTTVPQIFINGKHLGGYNDLYTLDARGGLDPLLK